MGESRNIREIIEGVVSASLTTHLAALKDELVDKACEQLEQVAPAAPAPTPLPGSAPTDLLKAAINSILDSTTQVDILGSLLEGASKFAQRTALFVIRSGAATGWRATGLEHNEGIKAITLDLSFGLVSRAYQDGISVAGSPAEFDAQFLSTYGTPPEGSSAIVLPLAIRDKVAALVYADAGMEPGHQLDTSALEVLVHSAGMWLEIMGARKSGASAAAATGSDTDRHLARYAEPAPPPVAPAMAPEPDEAAPPVYAVPPVESAPEPVYTPVAVAAVAAPEPEPAAAPAMQATASSSAATSGLSPEEEEVHKKARRFAKLLVDEIKLYNQAKVVEGRQHKDLYQRLKDDIDKSRITYDKRYGATSAASGNYFTQELIRILANDDPSLLGGEFGVN